MAGGRELVDIRETGTESPEDPDLCKLHRSELKATTDKIMWVHNLGHDGSNSKAPLALVIADDHLAEMCNIRGRILAGSLTESAAVSHPTSSPLSQTQMTCQPLPDAPA